MKSDLLYLVYDLETTGFDSKKHAVIEIAMYAMDQDLNDLSDYNSGIMHNYGREITQGALTANKISVDQINNGKEPSIVITEVIKFIKSLNKSKSKIILCGQNILDFDNNHLIDFFEINGKNLFDYVNKSHYIDTLLLGRIRHKESINYKLGTLCNLENIELVDAHRASVDTVATKELIKIYIRNLRGDGNLNNEKEIRYRDTFQF